MPHQVLAAVASTLKSKLKPGEEAESPVRALNY